MDRLNETASTLADPHARCERPQQVADGLLLEEQLARQPSLQERMARIVRTIEADIIPRLVRSHRAAPEAEPAPAAPRVSDDDVARFVGLVLAAGDGACAEMIASLRARGLPVESVYLELLSPCAKQLGLMWADDTLPFSDVTVGVGRLQRIMRSLSPAFGTEIDLPPDGRRALLLPAPGEQHTFGLSMVAEFFRRAGWDVVCELDSRVADPVALVRSEWFDVVGISVGVEARLDWLKSGIAAVRHASRNRAVGVMVGGPVFSTDAALAARVGADATAVDGRSAAATAEMLLNERASRL
jgi:methanogenic corrinoid protein MtbC1